MTWITEFHAFPMVDDEREHETSEKCWCKPFRHGEVIVHNAVGARGAFDRGVILQQNAPTTGTVQ